MQILLRKSTFDDQGLPQLTDFELSSDTLIIGSAPESEIQLLGNKIFARHAKIRQTGNGYQIDAEKGCQFIFNGAAVKQAALQQQDVIEIGQHRLTVIDTPPGFDLALQWQPAEVDGGLLANAYKTSLAQTELRARPLAWIAAIIIIILAGLLPVTDYLLRARLDQSLPTQPIERFTADNFWSTGPLHSAHRIAIGDRCESCHTQPFQQVQDQACEVCHSATATHVDSHSKHFKTLDDQSCQSCHKEHNEPGQLTNQNDALCVTCHSDLAPSVTGFGDARHPPLQLSLLTPEVIKNIGSVSTFWSLRKQAAGSAMQPTETLPAREHNHLKFSHQLHLDAAKVRNLGDDKALECSGCHVLTADREHFQPITMEASCIACHELRFDPSQPKKQLPHGDIANVYPTLEAHFVSLAFNKPAESLQQRRRLPARDSSRENCKANFECAKQQAIRENDRQFSQSGCITCHEVEKIEGADPQSRWQLLPVRLTGDWYPAAQFDHSSHLTQTGEVGNQLCESCHKASNSVETSDILIPALDNCTQCHGDHRQPEKVVMQCVSCHEFHPTTSAFAPQVDEILTAKIKTESSDAK